MTADLWCVGDSITAGTWLQQPGTESWPAQLDDLLGGGRVRNLGVGGIGVAHVDPPALPVTAVHVLQAHLLTAGQPPAAVVWAAGINDLIRSASTQPTRQAVLDLATWVTDRGSEFLVCTLTPYRSDAAFAETLSARRAEYNTWARAQFGPTGQLVDVGDVLTAGATFADPRFYVDHLHPNTAGAGMYAAAVHAVLQQKELS